MFGGFAIGAEIGNISLVLSGPREFPGAPFGRDADDDEGIEGPARFAVLGEAGNMHEILVDTAVEQVEHGVAVRGIGLGIARRQPDIDPAGLAQDVGAKL